MIGNFEQIKFLFNNANLYIPKSVFKKLSSEIKAKNGETNIKQASFAYSYLITVGFLYKYAMYINASNYTYTQNSDIKTILGYNQTTKSIDKIIKKDGILDRLNLTRTTKNYPIICEVSHSEEINGIPFRQYICIDDSNEHDKDFYKSIVKNRNYTVKEPLFLTEGYDDKEYGTLYSVKDTHCITIGEYLHFVNDEALDNIDFMIYGYFKSKCKGRNNDAVEIAVDYILAELGASRNTFFTHMKKLEERGFIKVVHRKWYSSKNRDLDFNAKPNKYYFKGIDKCKNL